MGELAKKSLRIVASLPIKTGISLYNLVIDILPFGKDDLSTGLVELSEIKQRSKEKKSDISSHLVSLFIESLEVNPKVIVELGVRGGESTYSLERVAKLCGSELISVDISDCSDVSSYERWHFVQMDDVEFAEIFDDWCRRRDIQPVVDVLFIDTSHQYEHTRKEIRYWFPYLARGSKVLPHDTNSSHYYFRKILLWEWGRSLRVLKKLWRIISTNLLTGIGDL